MEQEIVTYHKTITEKQRLVLYFILYAFLGWILETLYAFYVHGYFVKRGFLYGPICPIYGFGGVLLYLSLKNVKGNIAIKFLVAMLSFTIFEYIASYVLELAFHQRWWDYSEEFMNLQGRVCLAFSLFWGVIGILFINIIHPYVEKKVQHGLLKIPYQIQILIFYAIILGTCTDFLLSVGRYLK